MSDQPAPEPRSTRPHGAPVPPGPRGAAPALLGYAAVRVLGMAILAVAAAVQGKDALHRLNGRWDSVWYVRVAEHGYGYDVTLPDGSVHSDLAFFPLLPALERAVSEVLPVGAATAGLVIGWIAAFAAAWGVYAVGAQVAGQRAGVLLAVLWGVYPTAFVQSMAYTETLFTALAAWSLYAVLTDRWITAGTLCALAGLTRPSAAALVAAIGVTGLVRLFRRDLTWRTVVGVVVAPLGWLGYVVFVAVRQGSPTAYFDVQAAWGNNIDGGVALARFVGAQLSGPAPLAGIGLVAVIGLLLWVVWLCVKQRQPLPLLVYAAGIVVISLIGAAYFGSRPRLIMPAFPLLLPAAVALARPARRTTAAVVVALLAVASGAYGAFTLLGSGPP
ncbi:mannosyltransferase family protein [Streptomyces sp. NPDC059017]|uniref:mannosyltransferase family protein n=1 Tax=unclassified Streptomyces TaxID=2593676 RepID=UPI00368BFFF1